jgi:hypothetical protein
MKIENIQNALIRLFVALLIFFILYLPLLTMQSTCKIEKPVCEEGKLSGIFFCNPNSCFTLQDVAIELFLFGIAPFVIFYLLAYIVIRD